MIADDHQLSGARGVTRETGARLWHCSVPLCEMGWAAAYVQSRSRRCEPQTRCVRLDKSALPSGCSIAAFGSQTFNLMLLTSYEQLKKT